MDITCPACGTKTNRLTGVDGWTTEIYASPDGRLTERKSLAVIYACPRCEWCGTRTA